MILKYKYKFLTYMAIVIVSCIVFLTFFLSVNQGAQSEQTYEMTDHNIHQHNQKGTTQNYKDKQNSEQNDQSVFALVN
ncbi:DNA damage-induced cell division inhibitor SosA [Staphylococcus epidermidis]|uniref:DNA damage-induced cell division inhibitor SosA n=1 Tax=Staphylococcus epidermidis TaxID=1282 RepID=UPI00026C215F|nr:DNA damage-induced cell division inhibitor SosA [Staphylococcus epidermidis]ASJ93539.1 hypothetical protein CFE88_04525 [Staphylococcus epidermidis]ATQ59615.1 hypothetical protein CPZ21_05550 [Staphylococcus epidermidis]EJE04580.1 hypothetical protein HMPREF9983_11163 [Staphylococcus epidermidis NIHLM023]MBF2136151.1 hypothetical protein [Staphylococcus epidermidis]MBF2163447.1 hypothetical protein [Staphylococcus epidermidis]